MILMGIIIELFLKININNSKFVIFNEILESVKQNHNEISNH